MSSRGEAIAALREETEARWDDLREQRVLSKLRERMRARPAPSAPWRAITLGLASAAAVAALAMILLERPTPEQRTAWVLEDGSEVTMEDGARVEVEVSTPSLLRVAQRTGRARYAVAHRPERGFEVVTEFATVRVRGTVFSVSVLSDATEVSVTEGRVEVADEARVVLLGPGESVRVVASATTLAVAPPPPPVVDPPTPPAPPPEASLADPPRREPVDDAATLEARAIDARRAGRIDQAAGLFARAEERATEPEERARLAFTLGRVESMRGRARAAAQAFERCARADEEGALAEDATASAAEAWFGAGDDVRARAAAVRYLRRWPNGLHASGMRVLTGE